MSERPHLSPDRLRDHAIAALMPFFLEGLTGGRKGAREKAASALDRYQPVTPRDLQLAAQVVAYDAAMMACLRMTETLMQALSVRQAFDWQDVTIKWTKVSLKDLRALEARRKQREKYPDSGVPETAGWEEGAFQRVINQALEGFHTANEAFARLRPDLAPEPKLTFLFAEPMTPAILAWRSRR